MSRAIKAFASSETPVVIATYNNPKSLEIGSFVDEKNSIAIITNSKANFKPFSPLSGDTLVSLSNVTSEFNSNDIMAMKEIATCKCGAHLHTTAELAKVLAGSRLHCVVCGEEVDVNEISDDEEEMDEVESSDADNVDEIDSEEEIDDVENNEIEESSDEENVDEIDSDDVEIEESDAESEEEIDDVENDEIEESSDDEVEVEDNVDENEVEAESTNVEQQELEEKVEESSEDEVKEDEQLADETNANADDEDVESDDEEESTEDVKDEEISASVKKRITLNLFDKVKASAVDLVKVRNEPKYYLMCNYKPVATLNKDRASEEVKSFFDNEANMRSALDASLDKGFTKEVCATFGITPIKVSFRASKAVRQEIAKIKSKLANKALANVDDYKKRFSQALSIASVGVNKSIYGSNILRDALAKQCVLAGMVDAEDLVNEMFAKYGEDYIKEILEKAKELVEKSDEARNAEASVVANASFNCTVSKSVAKRLGSHIPVESKVIEVEASKSNGYSKLF